MWWIIGTIGIIWSYFGLWLMTVLPEPKTSKNALQMIIICGPITWVVAGYCTLFHKD